MMRFFIMGVFITCIANPAWAQTVGLRAADHESFTRVVFDTARPSEIAISKSGSQLTATLKNGAQMADTGGFFDRIGRNRIRAIEIDQSRTRVVFQLSCACDYEVFRASENMLVIDVLDGGPVQVTVSEKAHVKEGFRTNAAAQLGFGQRAAGHSNRVASIGLKHAPKLRFSTGPEKLVAPNGDVPKISITSVRDKPENLVALRLRRALEEQSRLEESVADDTNQSASQIESQISLRSLAKLQSRALPELEAAFDEGQDACKDLVRFNPKGWPKIESARQDLARLRSSYLSDGDEISSASAVQIAMLYLSLGLGAEARAFLRLTGAGAGNFSELVQLTFLIDGDLPLTQIPQSLSANCPDNLVWRLLSGEVLSPEDIAAARRDFDHWPSPLRGVLAASFAEKLNALGQPDAASLALRRAADAPERASGERELVKAQALEQQSDMSAAIEIRRKVLERDDQMSPKAAIELAANRAVNDRDTQDLNELYLPSYRAELEGSEQEAELIRASITTALRQEDFSQALGLFDSFSSLTRQTQADLVLDEIATAILGLESDAQFLREALSLSVDHYSNIGGDQKEMIKTRVKALGFEELANQMEANKRVAQTSFATSKPEENSERALTAPDAQRALISEQLPSSGARAQSDTSNENEGLEANAGRLAQSAQSEREASSRLQKREGEEPQLGNSLAAQVAATSDLLDGVAELKSDITSLLSQPEG